MICNFTWYNLPNQIKKLIKPFENQLSKEAKNITWYNLPSKLTILYNELSIINIICKKDIKFIWFTLNKKVEALCELVNCIESQINFDVISTNWGTLTTKESWQNKFLADGATTAVVTNFSLVNGRVKFYVNTDSIVLDLSVRNITVVNNISIASLKFLYLNNNQIITFNPTIALPSSLKLLYLYNNQIITFNPTIALPVSLIELDLNVNQMTTLGYTQSEPWANTQPSFTTVCNVSLFGNINSSATTNLRTILLTKNCSVIS